MNKKEQLIREFDPNGVGEIGKIFGLPFSEQEAELVLIPVPWEVTVSYRGGTADGPEAILEASTQVDLFVNDIPSAWKMGINMLPSPDALIAENTKYRDLASKYIAMQEKGKRIKDHPEMKIVPKAVNDICEKLNIYIKSEANRYLNQGKMVGIVGGDHSTPLGLIRALNDIHDDFGILQIDAHADLRKAYEGFKYSHASIMYNALSCRNISKLVQVGVRDCCEEEAKRIKGSKGRVVTFFEEEIREAFYHGNTWKKMTEMMVSKLPKKVYLSLDIDGLDPKYCPNTGTPVPGGLDFHQVVYLIKQVVKSGRKIIGFDLSEVAPGSDEWDGNVGARLLYNLCNWTGVSQGKLKTYNI